MRIYCLIIVYNFVSIDDLLNESKSESSIYESSACLQMGLFVYNFISKHNYDNSNY